MVYRELGARERAMRTLGQTIRARRREVRLTLEQLADAVGCAKGYLSQIENDRRDNPPSRDLLGRLEGALRLEPGSLVRLGQWQITPPEIRRQVARMRENNRLAEQLAEQARRRGLDDLHRSGELRRLIDRFAPGVDLEPQPLPAQVPIINKVSAGYPTEFTDLGYPARVADEYVSTPDLFDPQAFAARVVGDSMAPDYREGEIVVFSPQRDTPAGSDCFVRLERDHESTFKRVYFDRDEDGRELIRLQPLNNAYPPRTVPREDVAGMYAAAYVLRSV